MTVDKTFVPKANDRKSDWVLVDANGQGLGRLATLIAAALMGKNKPTFTPGADMGDFVVVVNAQSLNLTMKRMDTKFYYHHSGYPGGLKTVGLREQLRIHPDRVLRAAVWGMLPHNKYGRKIIKKLKIYPGNEHPHAAQAPKPAA
jgi:large subunit ribosomal protein L13